MSDLARLILGGLTAGADDSRQNQALLLHAQQIAEQRRRNDQLDQIRMAEEARNAQAFQADQAAFQGAQGFFGDQFRQMNPAPVASVPQGTEADFFMESPQQHQQATAAYQQQAGAFATMDPRVQQQEVARMRRESEDESTFRYLQSQGITAGELPDRALGQRFVNWKAKNQYDLSPNEFADPLPDLDAASARIAPFVQQPQQGPYAPGMAPMSNAPITPQQAEAYRAAIAMGMQPAQAAAVVFREDQQQDRFTNQRELLEMRGAQQIELAKARNELRKRGATVPYETREELLATFPNLASVADDMLNRYNQGAITFNDLQQENSRRGAPRGTGQRQQINDRISVMKGRLEESRQNSEKADTGEMENFWKIRESFFANELAKAQDELISLGNTTPVSPAQPTVQPTPRGAGAMTAPPPSVAPLGIPPDINKILDDAQARAAAELGPNANPNAIKERARQYFNAARGVR